MPDFEVLRQTSSLWKWGFTSVGFAVAATIATSTIGFFGLRALSDIETEAATKHKEMQKAKLAEEGIHRELWLKTDQELKDEQFVEVTLPSNVQLFVGPQNELPASIKVEAVIKRDKVAVAVADVLTPRRVATWDYGSDQNVLDGAVPTTIATAVYGSGIADSIGAVREGEPDVIAIGTESSASEVQAQPVLKSVAHMPLSQRRARELAGAAAKNPYFMNDGPRVYYWALDLGKATTPAGKGTAEEVKQRSTVIITISRRMTVPQNMGLRDVLATLIANVTVDGIKLSGFSNSATIAAHLESEERWNGGSVRPDQPPFDPSKR